jgi:hypothetical protein
VHGSRRSSLDIARAVVGSLAVASGDRFSDLDLTFSGDDHVSVASSRYLRHCFR